MVDAFLYISSQLFLRERHVPAVVCECDERVLECHPVLFALQ
jgi:hypothetical protein